jgi:hypothetical protein
MGESSDHPRIAGLGDESYYTMWEKPAYCNCVEIYAVIPCRYNTILLCVGNTLTPTKV